MAPVATGRNNRAAHRGRAAFGLMTLLVVAGTSLSGPAHAQFFWDQPRFSADDAARVAMQHGYRVLTRPTRNDDVYIADVLDRRGVRARLIIASETGQILQRFVLEGQRRPRLEVDPTIPPGPVPPARVPEREDRHPGFFARLFGNDDDDRAPAPAALPQPDRPFMTQPEQPRQRPRRRPQVVEQMPGIVRAAPIESAPLAPPSAVTPVTPRAPVPARAPAQASLPPPVAPTAAPALTAVPPSPAAATDRPGRAISSNPLAIPGSREDDDKAVALRKTAPKAVSGGAEPPKDPVAVAPLE